MTPNAIILCLYAFFWLVRVNGCVRRGRQPLLRGEQWFFDVPVPACFYSGVGRTLLIQYWLRMLIPFTIDIPLAIYFICSGHVAYLCWLVIGLAALIHINHGYSVEIAERGARRCSSTHAQTAPTIVASSLSPRRLRDYSDLLTESILALSIGVGLSETFRYYSSNPGHHDPRLVFGIPGLYLYLQLGMLLIKRYVIAWRSPVPQSNSTEHIALREKTRTYYLKICDWCRLAFAAVILIWPWILAATPDGARHLLQSLFWISVFLASVGTVWVEWKRKQLANARANLDPIRLPDLLNQSKVAGWPLCFQPAAPMMILRGARGYSLNFANRLTYLSAAYLAGMAVLLMVLPISL